MDQPSLLGPRGADPDGRDNFDFLFGRWRIANHKRTQPLVQGSTEWVDFDARLEARPVLGGLGNVDAFSAAEFPGRGSFEGGTLRLFQPSTGLWRIWWMSTIGDGLLDVPVVGRFDGDRGVFECEDVIEGLPVRVRYVWTVDAPDAPRWQQFFSFDDGATWDLNWTMDLTREGH